MTRPTDADAALEAELAALVPAAPSAALRRRVAAALVPAPAARPVPGRWLGERLLWACGGAVAATLVFALVGGSPPASSAVAVTASAPAAVATANPPVEVAGTSVTWSDGGIRFIDGRTPTRILRRSAVERHRRADGPDIHFPREDVVLLPVALL